MISIDALNDIEQDILKVNAIVCTVRDSCENNCYSNESLCLSEAVGYINNILDKLFENI